MREDVLMLDPGPVPATCEVRRAADAPVVNHRSAVFEATDERARDGLDYDFEWTVSPPDGAGVPRGHSLADDGRWSS